MAAVSPVTTPLSMEPDPVGLNAVQVLPLPVEISYPVIVDPPSAGAVNVTVSW